MIRTILEEHFDHYWQARIPELEAELDLPDSQVRRLCGLHLRRRHARGQNRRTGETQSARRREPSASR